MRNLDNILIYCLTVPILACGGDDQKIHLLTEQDGKVSSDKTDKDISISETL